MKSRNGNRNGTKDEKKSQKSICLTITYEEEKSNTALQTYYEFKRHIYK